MSNETPLEGKDVRWDEVRSKALRALERPERLEPRGRIEGRAGVLRLFRFPSDGTWESWTLFRSFERGTPSLVRRVRWHADRDRPRVYDPVDALRHGSEPLPTIELADLRLDAEAAEALLDDYCALPEADESAEKPNGDTGTAFGIRDLTRAEPMPLTWWNDGPDEWRPQVEWASRARELLDGRVAEFSRGLTPAS